VHKKSITACVLWAIAKGRRRKEKRRFGEEPAGVVMNHLASGVLFVAAGKLLNQLDLSWAEGVWIPEIANSLILCGY